MKTAHRSLIVAACGIIVAAVPGCRSGTTGRGKGKKPRRVMIATAERRRIQEILETTGDVVAVNTVTLRATVEGPISFCPWREGDRVERAGQKLVAINRPLYRQQVATAASALAAAGAKLADLKAGARPEEIAQAKESVRHFEDCTDFARADMQRIKSLVESGSLPAETVEKARVSYVKCHTQFQAAKEQLAMLEAGPTKTEIAVAQAAVDEAAAKRKLAQSRLDECVLTAPFAGIITQVYVRPGDLAEPRRELLKMMDPSSLVIRAGLPESCAAHIRTGTEAVVRLDAYPGRTFEAKIERVYPRLERESRTRIVEVTVTDPVALIPHMFARISVRGRAVDDAVVIPDPAIVTTPRGWKVVYVVQEGTAHRRKVKVGIEREQHIQITGGVKAGENVVIKGNLNLKDGAKVRPGTAASAPAVKKPPEEKDR